MTDDRKDPRDDDLHAALVGAQLELTDPRKNQTAKVTTRGGGSYSYGFADLPSILALVRPVLNRHGLALTQRFVDQANRLTLRTEIRHVGGQLIASDFVIPTVGDDGPLNDQQIGSSITYRRRYSVLCLLGLAADDDDGAIASGVTSSQFQAPKRQPAARTTGSLTTRQRDRIVELRDQLVDVGTIEEDAFNQQIADDYNGATLDTLTRDQARLLIDRLDAAVAKMQERQTLAQERGEA